MALKEFYKMFWPKLAPMLHTFLSYAITQPVLPTSLTTWVITLIYKKGNKHDIKNYRPITLLTTNYKILSKIVVQHIQTPLQKVISPYQLGFIPQRSIQEILHFSIEKLFTHQSAKKMPTTGATLLVLSRSQQSFWLCLSRVPLPHSQPPKFPSYNHSTNQTITPKFQCSY